MRKLLLLLAFSIALASGTVAAQFISMRFLPPNGVRGTLGATVDFPAVVIGNRILRLNPGARIYDQMNRTIVHTQLPPGSEVLFLPDQAGNVQRIYILTEQELLQLRAASR
jgi:hypothetical protein